MKTHQVLLADRCPVLRQGLRHLLEADEGRWEICAESGDASDLVELAARLKPDLLILDNELFDLTSPEAAGEIRRAAPASEILLYIGNEKPCLLARYNQSKVRGCLLKSEPIDELLPALEVILRHHHFRSHKITELCEAYEVSNQQREPLTPRELDTLRLIAQDYSTKEIAAKLGLSIATIETHRTNLMRKLGLHSVAGLVRYAIEHGLVEL